MKVVINACFGGFGLSKKAIEAYYARKGKAVYFADHGLFASCFDAPIPEGYNPRSFTQSKEIDEWSQQHHLSEYDIKRDDPDLVAVVEELGSDAASGSCAELRVVEIPDDVSWHIHEYDGSEHVAEDHQTWS